MLRGRRVFVILNRYPYANGHVMVAPTGMWPAVDVGSRDAAGAHLDSGAAERVLVETYRTDGMNVGINFGSAAGAGVADHYHVHVVPRWKGDTNFMTVTGDVRIVPEELRETRRRLERRLRRRGGLSESAVPRGRAATAALLAWIVPGLGHYYLGRRRTGLLFAIDRDGLLRAGPLLRGTPLHGGAGTAAYDPCDVRRVRRGHSQYRGADPSPRTSAVRFSRRPTNTAARSS